jgi:hypothetical protein
MHNLTPLEIARVTETEFNKISTSSTKDVPVADLDIQARRFFNNAHAFGGAPLLELLDQEWFPKILRDYVTDALDQTRPGAPMKWVYEPKPTPSSQGVACCDVVNRGASYLDGKIFYNTLDITP